MWFNSDLKWLKIDGSALVLVVVRHSGRASQTIFRRIGKILT